MVYIESESDMGRLHRPLTEVIYHCSVYFTVRSRTRVIWINFLKNSTNLKMNETLK